MGASDVGLEVSVKPKLPASDEVGVSDEPPRAGAIANKLDKMDAGQLSIPLNTTVTSPEEEKEK